VSNFWGIGIAIILMTIYFQCRKQTIKEDLVEDINRETEKEIKKEEKRRQTAVENFNDKIEMKNQDISVTGDEQEKANLVFEKWGK